MTDEDCTMNLAHRDGVPVLVVSGEVDRTVATRLDGALASLVEGEHAVVLLDLSGVTFLDSGALHVLLRRAAGLREAGRRLQAEVRPGSIVERVLTVCDPDRLIALSES